MLSYNWSALAAMVADLKALVGYNLNARLAVVEANPPPDIAPLTARVTALEATAAPDLTAILARLDALETAVNELSAQVAAYPPPQ